MSFRKSLFLFIKNAAILYGIFIINGVHGSESRSSGGSTSSNPPVSALPRPAFNGMERMCHGSTQTYHPPVLVQKRLCNQFIHNQISSSQLIDPYEMLLWSKSTYLQTDIKEIYFAYFLLYCPQLNVTMRNWWLVNICSGNGLVLPGNQPLPVPIFTNLQVALRRH